MQDPFRLAARGQETNLALENVDVDLDAVSNRIRSSADHREARTAELHLRFLHGDVSLVEATLGARRFLPLGAHRGIGNALVEQRGLAIRRFGRAFARLRFARRSGV